MRVAGAPIAGRYGWGLGGQSAARRRRAELDERVEAERAALVDRLYTAVPHLEGEARRAALTLKRAIFNGREVGAETAALPEDLAAAVLRFAALQRASTAEVRRLSRVGVARERAALAALLDDPLFARAIAYAGPSLAAAVETRRAPRPDRFTKVETSLYDLATRFSTKATPFFLYGQVAFAPGSGYRAPGGATVELSLPHAHVLEHHALATADGDPWVMAHDWVEADGEIHVYTAARVGITGVRRLPASEAVGAALAAVRGGALRESALVAALAARGLPEEGAARLVDALARARVLQRYYLDDPATWVEDLAVAEAIGPDRAAALRAAQGEGLALDAVPERFDAAALFGADVARRAEASPQPAAYVTRFFEGWPGAPFRALHEAAVASLEALAPLLGAFPAVAPERRALRARVRRAVEAAGGRMPYPDLIVHLRQTAGDAAPDPSPPPALLGALRAAEGELRASEVAAWAARVPPPPPLCVNGPVDAAAGRLHVTNLWGGDGRYLRRYRAAAPPRPCEGPARPLGADPPLEVTVYEPLLSNLNDAAPSCEGGFAVTARHRARFDVWVTPSDVVAVATEGGGVRFEHGPSGRPIRFRHDGLVLTRELILEYRVVLQDVVDTYLNPFERPVPTRGPDVVYDPGCHFGAVGLRRPRWAVRRSALPALPRSAVGAAAALEAWAGAHLGAADAYYYRIGGGASDTHKPRYLDLSSALSAASFRRRVRKLAADDRVTFEAAAPGRGGLLRIGGQPWMSETMVELEPRPR